MGPIIIHHASPAPSGDTPIVDKGSQAERQSLGASATTMWLSSHSLGMCADLLKWRAHLLLTSGPEIASKDLMHQGSSLCLPIQPKRKPRP
jgi:hypothetical protein